jgi:GAF domain-containing protein
MTKHEFAKLIRLTMAEIAEKYASPTDLNLTLSAVTKAAVRHVPGTYSADILMVRSPGQYESIAPSSPIASRIDDHQQEFREGPCVSAAVGETIVRCDDLRNDARWPRFARAAVAAGVLSMLSFQLYTHDQHRAALNLLGSGPNAFTQDAEALAAMLATHAATALIAHDKEVQFRSALASRDVIGQAKGMIMERFDVDAVRAFELLVRLSQTANTPVTDIAADLVRGRAR